MKGHPSLRRLLAFGTTPRLSVEVIRRREKALTRLVRELDLPLVDEAPIEPLFRELDGFASLARAVGRANSARSEVSATKPPRSEQPMPWSRASVASEQASVPGKPREREAPGRTTRAHCERATQRRAPPGEPISEQSQRAVAALLAGYEAPAAAPDPVRRTATQRKPSVAVSRAAAPSGAFGQTARNASQMRAFSASIATTKLRERAQRVGAAAALDTPLDSERPSSQIAELLDGHDVDRAISAPQRAKGQERANRNAEDRASAPGVQPAQRHAATLSRVLERIPSRQTRSATARAFDESSPPEPEAEANVGGLRGLVARAAAAQSSSSPPGVPPNSERQVSTLELPSFVAERLTDEQVAQRVDRVLRAEALRQGIDIEGVNS